MAKAKGIRLNQLAKELGVTSKEVIERCKAEGIPNPPVNHQSVLSAGLEASVREWFPAGAGGVATAVEPAAAETETADEPKHKATRRRKKADEEGGPAASMEAEAPAEEATPSQEHPHEPEPATAAPQPAAEAPVAPPAVPAQAIEAPPAEPAQPAPVVAAPPTAPEVRPAAEAPVQPAAEAPAAPAPTPAVAPVQPVPAEVAPAAGPRPAPAQPVAPAPAAAATAAPVVPPAAAATAAPAPARPSAPGRPGAAKAPTAAGKPAHKPIVPAPRLVVPAPAKIQGPRIVREEQPDIVPTPRRRLSPQGPSAPPSFVQARAQAGRGVKAREDDVEDSGEAPKKTGTKGKSLSSRRRGPDGRRGEADEKLREWTQTDIEERRERLLAADRYRAGFDSDLKRKSERGHGQRASAQRGNQVEVEEPLTIKALSAALGIKSNEILLKLMRKGVMTNVNAALAADTAATIALDYGMELVVKGPESLEDQLEKELAMHQSDPANLVPRPPIVTILGHVDHGKTSLLDKIRKANVAAGEAGGITQHVAAWTVQIGEKRVTFIDTPGHQAFTSMRARGAEMTDVVVLVVSAAEGVQPQTIESINHARSAEVPIVVALNKIDRPDSNEQMVLGQLAAQGLNPVEWGGDTEVIRTSAVTGQGIQELIEILDYRAELLELRADPAAPARGTVIEARVDEGLGSVATVLVQDGTLRVGDVLLSGWTYGRVRSLVNDRGEMVQEAGPSTPVIVSGLDELPTVGEKFFAIEDLEQARSIAEDRKAKARETDLAKKNVVSAENLLSNIAASQVKTINLIVKGDVQGSVETLAKTVTDYNTEEVKVKVIHAAVGAINESDVELAAATTDESAHTVIIGFHVVPDESARLLAEQRHVEVREYRVIYEIFDDLKKALSGMLEPEVREKRHGHAEVRQLFKVPKVGVVAGCMVTDGHIQRGSKMRLIRNGVVVVDDLGLDSLKRLKDDVKEVKAGFECGLKLSGYDDVKIGDRLEAYSRELIHRTL